MATRCLSTKKGNLISRRVKLNSLCNTDVNEKTINCRHKQSAKNMYVVIYVNRPRKMQQTQEKTLQIFAETRNQTTARCCDKKEITKKKIRNSEG